MVDFQSRFSRNAYFTDTSVCDVADELLKINVHRPNKPSISIFSHAKKKVGNC